MSDRFETDSAAVSSEETGKPIYPWARLKLQEKHIPIGDHRARRIRPSDYQAFDEIYLTVCRKKSPTSKAGDEFRRT